MVALVLITVFFITSLDSGALVLDAMASGHEDEAPVRQRVFWTLAVGAICVSLLLGPARTRWRRCRRSSRSSGCRSRP